MSRAKKPEQDKMSLEQMARRKRQDKHARCMGWRRSDKGKARHCVMKGKVKGGGIDKS